MIDIQYYLADGAVAPAKAKSGDMCYDLCNHETATLEKGVDLKVGTGVYLVFPKGWGGKVYPRSSTSEKWHAELANGTGIIDQGYRGEVILKLALRNNYPFSTLTIPARTRLAQLEIVEIHDTRLRQLTHEQFMHLSETDRGSGGFGSTGTGVHVGFVEGLRAYTASPR